MASIERGLGAKRVHAKSTVSMHVSKGLEQGQACAHVRSRATHIARRAANAMQSGLRRPRPLCAPCSSVTKKMKMYSPSRRRQTQRVPCKLARDASLDGRTRGSRAVRKCQSLINYGETEDPAKMTYSRLDLIERCLLDTTPRAKSQRVDRSTAPYKACEACA